MSKPRTINLKPLPLRSVLPETCQGGKQKPGERIVISAFPSASSALPSVIPALSSVIPTKVGIQKDGKLQAGFVPSDSTTDQKNIFLWERKSLDQNKSRCSVRYQIGFTLVELTVAFGIFATVMAVATGVLLDSLKTMRHVASQARAVDNISLTMEQMVREIRTGSNISLPNAADGFAEQVNFINHKGYPVAYSFCGTRMCRNGSPITVENTVITGGFIITNFGGTKTPRITVTARATDTKGNVLGFMQTTVSARLIPYRQ